MNQGRHGDVDYRVFFAVGVASVIVTVSLVIFFFVFNKKEVHTSVVGQNVNFVNVLYCKARDVVDPFFISQHTTDYSHEIKITFVDGRPDKISYNYYGVYENEEMATDDSAVFNAKYNIFLGENNVSQDVLYPTFAVIDKSVKINLYADEEGFNSVTARFFFLDDDKYYDFYKLSSNYLTELYMKKGFSCVFNKEEINEE